MDTWIPINDKERLPPPWDYPGGPGSVLVNDEEYGVTNAYLDSDGAWTVVGTDIVLRRVTHHMPLPEPPSVKQGKTTNRLRTTWFTECDGWGRYSVRYVDVFHGGDHLLVDDIEFAQDADAIAAVPNMLETLHDIRRTCHPQLRPVETTDADFLQAKLNNILKLAQGALKKAGVLRQEDE